MCLLDAGQLQELLEGEEREKKGHINIIWYSPLPLTVASSRERGNLDLPKPIEGDYEKWRYKKQ